MKPLPKATPAYDRDNEQTARKRLEEAIADIQRPGPKYLVDDALSATAARVLTSEATADDLRLVLAALLIDLRKKGIIS